MSEVIIRIENVGRSVRTGFWLKPIQILADVSFDVHQGSVCGIVGSNGAGKTSLIQLIAGIRHPTTGSIRVAGLDSTCREARRRIGYLPERPYFYEHLTGRAFLRLFGRLSGMDEKLIRIRSEALLEQVGLRDAAGRELRTFSKGMLQRIGIAQALVHEPDVVILDEPMSGLDPDGRGEVKRLIADMSSSGKTVLFSSHQVSDVIDLCDRVALVKRGRIERYGPVSDALFTPNGTMEILVHGQSAESLSSLLGSGVSPRRYGAGWLIPVSRADLPGCLTRLLEKGVDVRRAGLSESFSDALDGRQEESL